MLTYSIADSTALDSGGKTRLLFEDADKNAYLDFRATSVTGNMPVTLEAGEYTLTFEYDYGYDDAHPAQVEISFSITKFGFAYPFAEQTGSAA
jgi:hypothetical protein